MPDWQALRESGKQIRQHTLEHLDFYLEEFETNCTRAGGVVHWARNAEEARQIVVRLVKASGSGEVIKIKSMITEEIQLNAALEAAGIHPFETDLAELIIQLGHDQPSHIVVPALHKNRHQIREIFQRTMNLQDLGDQPQDLADAARLFLREKFLRVKTGVSGANFLIAETGGVCVVESEGNGRMCLTLPETLITIAGIDKIIPRFQDLEVLLQLLPRSATGERMNPYNSIWTGVDASDGPPTFHIVLMDNARTEILADPGGRARPSIAFAVEPARTPAPSTDRPAATPTAPSTPAPSAPSSPRSSSRCITRRALPFASSLCGACYEVCPVKINIPEVLIHLRNKVVLQNTAGIAGLFDLEAAAMKTLAAIFRSERRFQAAQRLGRMAQAPLVRKRRLDSPAPRHFRLAAGHRSRDLQPMPQQTFRDWWAKR